jgi:hypothetical protein
MRSLPEARKEESLSPREIVAAGFVVIGFVVCSVAFAKVAYTIVDLFLQGATYAVVSLY